MRLKLTIINPTGLHARPAALFTSVTKRFLSNVRIRNLSGSGQWVDAKSIVGVLSIGAECKHEIEVDIEGPDEGEATEALRRAIEGGLGEGNSPVPPSAAVSTSGPASTPPAESSRRVLSGIPGAPGIAIGAAYVWHELRPVVPRRSGCNAATERARLDGAREAARTDLERLRAKVTTDAGAGESAIFAAHEMFLDDPSLLEATDERLRQGVNAEAAWMDSVTEAAGKLRQVADETLAARAADLLDVGERVLTHLLGTPVDSGLRLSGPSIILASDLTPSQTGALDKSLVLGFCTAKGGPTAHTAILARALQIPAVLGLGDAILSIPDAEMLIVDGSAGTVTRAPSESEVAEARKRKAVVEKSSSQALALAEEPAITIDGRRVEVVANVGSVEDSRKALKFGAEGIGLLRTEFLYLQRDTAPSEDEQFEAYRAILDVMQARPVVVRTLDIGGDKQLPYLDLPREDNPFLGWRAIRVCLERPDIFQPQLRALLRAAVGHNVRIMFPMIATLEEIRAARAAVAEARKALLASGAVAAENVQLGMMVEIPSAAILADRFAKEVDFFSIGTNDLTQYTMAAERTNARVAQLGDAIHPSVLRLIRQVTDAAHAAGRWVGICGELGGDVDAIPILLGLGVDELSMTPALIPQAKATIRSCNAHALHSLAERVLALDTADAVRAAVRTAIKR